MANSKFIELTEVTTGGISAGDKKSIMINVDKIASFYPQSNGEGTYISLRRDRILVKESYETVKGKVQ